MNVTLNFTDIPMDAAPPAQSYGWQEVLRICGQWDTQALGVAWTALFLTIATMFYFLRWRKHVTDQRLKLFLDKLSFTMILFAWVIVIVRMMRAA